MKEKYTQSDLFKAHTYIFDNYKELQRSTLCGCYFCEKTFFPYEVKEYVADEDGGLSALCPYCKSLSVVSDASGYRISKALLHKMKKQWY